MAAHCRARRRAPAPSLATAPAPGAASASGMRSGSSTTTVARRTAVRRAARRTMQSSAWPASGSPNKRHGRTGLRGTRRALDHGSRAAEPLRDPRGPRGIGRPTARRRCAPSFDGPRLTRPSAATRITVSATAGVVVRPTRTVPSSTSSKTIPGPVRGDQTVAELVCFTAPSSMSEPARAPHSHMCHAAIARRYSRAAASASVRRFHRSRSVIFLPRASETPTPSSASTR